MCAKRMVFNWKLPILLGILFSVTKSFGQFPIDPKPCKYGDITCIEGVIDYLLTKKFEGEPSMNMPTLDPLIINQIHLKQGDESPISIDLKFTNISVQGLRNTDVLKAKGFERDLTQKHEVHLKLNVNLVSDYEIKGKVLILPINGHGRSNVSLINTIIEIPFEGQPVEKDENGVYLKTKHLRIGIKPERMLFNFGNLFNGDKALGDNMNLFLNENWREIFNELKGQFSKSFSKEFARIINTVFQHMPYDKYFIN